jgi:hypothetical protein
LVNKPAPLTASPKLVRATRSGNLLEVKGFGALKGQLKVAKGIDLTKPIYEQVSGRSPLTSDHKS